MKLLEEIDNLALDVNRAIIAMVFFVRTPPRTDTDEKFLELARTATLDFRGLQAKAMEANEAYPDADTSIMSLELTIEAIQSYLVNAIRQMRLCLNEWTESQKTLSPGPSLDFLQTIASEMHTLVESVISSTKSIRKVASGEGLDLPQIRPLSPRDDLPDISPTQAHDVLSLLQDPSPNRIELFLAPSTPSNPTLSPQNLLKSCSTSKLGPERSFEAMLADAERQERRAHRKHIKVSSVTTRQVPTREGIDVDSDTLDAIILHLSDLTATFFTEDNSFGQRPSHLQDSDTISMPHIAEKRTFVNEILLSLQTSSIDMESFLNNHQQNSLAKLTNLHMKDILATVKDVLHSSPNVSWNALHRLDVAIKDYATTIKDVVDLASPQFEEVIDDDGAQDSETDSDDEPTPIVKATRKLTKEEEMMIAFDGFADALDAVDIDMSRKMTLSSPNLDFGSPRIDSPTISQNGDIRSSGFNGYTNSSANSNGGLNSGSSSPRSVSSSSGQPRSWTSSEIRGGHMRAQTQARSSVDIGSYQSSSSVLSSSSSHTTHTTQSGNGALSDSLPSTPRESRVTLQFPNLRPRSVAPTSPGDKPFLTSSKENLQVAEDRRATLQPTKSASFIESSYEIADEAIRQADALKVPDRWSVMQARSEEQRTIPQDPTSSTAHEGDWENSKVKAAFKFMSKKVGDIKKKYGEKGNRSSTNLTSSSSSLKRKSVMLANSGAMSSSSGGSGPSSPATPRRSMQLTGINSNDPRLLLFEAPDDDSNLRISPETYSVLAGTIEKLVQRLTHDSMPDPDFVLHFLTTHRCFITSTQLLELLCLRWDTSPPPDQDAATFESTRLPSIRLRVYNVLKTWVEKFWSDFQNDTELIERLRIFAAAMYHGGLSSASQTLTNMIQKNLANEAPQLQLPEPPAVHDFVRRSRREAPVVALPATPSGPEHRDSIIPQTMSQPAILLTMATSLPRPLSILDFHPAELARQLSYMEFELWRQVKNVELLDVAWTRKDKEARAPNVLNMIRFSNHITNWMISEILAPDDPKERAVVLNRCIWMVKTLIELHNFNGCMEALSAFHSSAIYRLKSTWNLLPSSSWALFENLEKLMSPDANFKTYRAEYDRSVPPFTPYLGTHLSDLLFLEETLPRYLEGQKLINFAKMEKTSQFIQTLELSQQIPYSFTPVPLIISYIKDFPELSPKDAYNRSLAVEARKQKTRPNSTYHMSRVSTVGSDSSSQASPKELAPGST